MTAPLERRLSTRDAVLLGLGAMVGAGIFAAPGPAAAAAGSWLPLAVVLAGFVAWCNATSSARLAAAMPQAGGTYVYAGRMLSPTWGHLAGWAFVVGKTASCAAMALTVGAYAWPGHERPVALVALVLIAGLGSGGVQRGVRLTRWLLAVALVALAVVVAAGVWAGARGGPAGGLSAGASGGAVDGMTGGRIDLQGVLQAAGLMFFAFAGYARLATLGEEVRDPRRTIPRAIGISLGLALALYLVVVVTAITGVGAPALARAPDPLAAVVAAAHWDAALPVVRVGATAASLGALLGLLLGVSRTGFAMARDGHLPRVLVAVRGGVPYRAELAAAALVAVVVAVADVRNAIGFSSFTVLGYYTLAQCSAWRLGSARGAPPRGVIVAGAAGCVVMAATLPRTAVLGGALVLALGVLAGRITGRPRAGIVPESGGPSAAS